MAPVGGPTAHTQGHTTYLLEQGTTVWSTSYKIYMRGSDSPTYVSSGRGAADNKGLPPPTARE
jgi:hypothetical protein